VSRRAAGRYALSLLDVAVSEGDPEQVAGELAGFVALMHESAELRRVLTNPGIPAARKRPLAQAIAERSGVSSPVAKLLVMLAGRNALSLAGEILHVYRESLLERQQTVRAEVITAAPLGAGHREALEKGLSRATGKRIALDLKVDPAIIGGIVTRIGSTVYDGSVVRQLERIKERLTQD
jgi:F-type H+-transporting ATPase subunit delta